MPKSRLQAQSVEQQTNENVATDFLMPSNAGHLCVPRTPGVDGGQVINRCPWSISFTIIIIVHLQSGRIRKCSIVQEEEDDEDDGDDDENITLNRRGSRSEGRINVTVQDRIAETDRIKKEAAAVASAASASILQPKGIFEGMCGVTLITGDGDLKEKLGVGRHILRPRTANDMNRSVVAKPKPPPTIDEQLQQPSQQRSNSVDTGLTRDMDDVVSTIFLTDSSTISLPIASQTAYTPSAGASKYKTMPSPTRANTILPGANCLNEIFEEGTDVGSSDSATTTPRPVARHTHYVNNRTQSQGSSSGTATTSAQRRSKFHKTRTASCSSSDASDDDSENRKKRAHKIVDSTKPLPQRRDSHDDSSDSQDPGNAASSGGSATAAATTCPMQSIVGPHDEPTKNGGTRQGGDTNSNGRQKSGQPMGFRRHRAGRRRAGETRLRESQSLNRITEVQESEMPQSLLMQSGAAQTTVTTTTMAATAVLAAPTANKPKGFSARLFQGFRRNETSSSVTIGDPPRIPLQNDVEMVLGVELAKALKVTETKSSSATKKLKMLGRYFQVSFFLNCLLFVGW